MLFIQRIIVDIPGIQFASFVNGNVIVTCKERRTILRIGHIKGDRTDIKSTNRIIVNQCNVGYHGVHGYRVISGCIWIGGIADVDTHVVFSCTIVTNVYIQKSEGSICRNGVGSNDGSVGPYEIHCCSGCRRTIDLRRSFYGLNGSLHAEFGVVKRVRRGIDIY